MGLRAFNSSVTIIAFHKEGKKFGMTCAWCSQVGYHEIACLIGEQSITGKKIAIGDIIGVSALAPGQEEVASFFGDHHSNEVDKFAHFDYQTIDNAILINGSKMQMKCQVIDILHLKGIEEDHFVYAKVLDYKEDETKSFLTMEDYDHKML